MAITNIDDKAVRQKIADTANKAGMSAEEVKAKLI
jgi:cell division protein FtsL